MGTIVERKRKDGSRAYTAQIRIKRAGAIVHSEAQTFDRRPAASAWLKKRETELAVPGALDEVNAPDVTLGDAIDEYCKGMLKVMGKTKAQCLETIRKHPLAGKNCRDIASADIAGFAKDLLDGWTPEGDAVDSRPRKPQTVGNYLSHLGSVFSIARPMWGFKLNQQAFKDATTVSARMGLTSRSETRDRRPKLEELDLILSHFTERGDRKPSSMPMDKIILFALFSARRLEEITRLQWIDYDPKNTRILVRDMKHPGQKIGNNVWCTLPDHAMAVIDLMPRGGEFIFPFNHKTISANFTRACPVVGVEDLHFHDLRHEGVSRLFELGWDIPHVATVSGHRSWVSLKRYTHIRQMGDKYEGWQRLPSRGNVARFG